MREREICLRLSQEILILISLRAGEKRGRAPRAAVNLHRRCRAERGEQALKKKGVSKGWSSDIGFLLRCFRIVSYTLCPALLHSKPSKLPLSQTRIPYRTRLPFYVFIFQYFMSMPLLLHQTASSDS